MEKTPNWWNTRPANASLKTIGVVQATANHDPDVDAIYRLQRKLPLNFGSKLDATNFPVPLGTWSPFNAQATLWATPDSFWGMYCFGYLNGRLDPTPTFRFQRVILILCDSVLLVRNIRLR